MHYKKKIIVTLWAGAIVLLALFFFLPDKANNYFLSLRVLNNEKTVVQARANEPRNAFDLFRNDKDDARVLKMLESRAQDDAKWLVVHIGLIFLAVNSIACLLYVFNMSPAMMAVWVSGYLLVTGLLVLQSYIRINP